ncbi:hypothetical protein Sps_02170 [Shewanella psychrophila]|uniref:DUF3568 domain-containing protein n=1 Tax=Shewanella psychrophila TaxID=225848 RepID=A0A1S6HP98_9GAMM|nr:DUF3568 domain-containing protein [Shewanella psychrophila]AQS37328.1 hypothetical protein Sps_02170 [Shewanella psychrophila]
MKKLVIMLLISLSVSGCAGIATIGAVMYYKSQNHEVASVDIEAPAKNVYQVAIKTIQGKPNVTIVNKNDSAMQLDILKNETSGSIKVTALNSKLSQLTIVSDLTADNETTPLSAVLKICNELKVKCEQTK